MSPSFPCTQISQLVALLIGLMPDTPLIDSKDPSGAMFGQPLWGLLNCPAGDQVITVSLVIHILVKCGRRHALPNSHIVTVSIVARFAVGEAEEACGHEEPVEVGAKPQALLVSIHPHNNSRAMSLWT